jgi:DNA-binding MarR family transcriptional regulator
VIVTANNGAQTFQNILTLKQEMDTLIVGFGKKAHNASKLIEFLYQRPIISISEIIEPLEISKPTANTLVKEFEAKGILKEITGYERNKLFVFDRYLTIYSKN